MIKFGWFSLSRTFDTVSVQASLYYFLKAIATIWYYMILYDDTINYMILFDDVPVSNDLCFLCWKLLEEMTVTSENPTMRGLIRYWRCMTVMMKTWNMKTMITGEDQRQYFDNILTNIAPSATHLNTLLWNIPSAHSSPGLTI